MAREKNYADLFYDNIIGNDKLFNPDRELNKHFRDHVPEFPSGTEAGGLLPSEKKPMADHYWLGTAPFCNAKPSDCESTPGYVFAEYSSIGDGASCWSGQKVKCVKKEKSDIKYAWFGSAPFCNENPFIDIVVDGWVPIKVDRYGDGSNCVKGFKVLARNPINKQESEVIEWVRSVTGDGAEAVVSEAVDGLLEALSKMNWAFEIVKFLKSGAELSFSFLVLWKFSPERTREMFSKIIELQRGYDINPDKRPGKSEKIVIDNTPSWEKKNKRKFN